MVEFFLIITGLLTIVIASAASLSAMTEVDERRKNYEAGTHDYYGNKL